ncbi:MAG: hypothetical protein HOP31_03510 [Ignavibacteria bacterium]|nr:hypothetical protein [Ignavibacteria bacterium]
MKINDNAKIIKQAKISGVTEILQTPGKEDTIKSVLYDTDGYILKEITKVDTSFEKKGEFITRKYYFIYNNFKLLTEKVDSSSPSPTKYSLKYDELYNMTDEAVFVNNKQVQKFDYEYDDLSRLIEATKKDMVNDCKIVESYDYDSYNNLVLLTTKNKCIPGDDKPILVKYNYKYDKDYRILGKITSSSAGEYKTETFTYTADGKPESSYEITGMDSYVTRKYVYENNMVRIKKIETIGELSTSSDILIKYDQAGNRLLEEYYDPSGKLLYSYKFVYNYY